KLRPHPPPNPGATHGFHSSRWPNMLALQLPRPPPATSARPTTPHTQTPRTPDRSRDNPRAPVSTAAARSRPRDSSLWAATDPSRNIASRRRSQPEFRPRQSPSDMSLHDRRPRRNRPPPVRQRGAPRSAKPARSAASFRHLAIAPDELTAPSISPTKRRRRSRAAGKSGFAGNPLATRRATTPEPRP